MLFNASTENTYLRKFSQKSIFGCQQNYNIHKVYLPLDLSCAISFVENMYQDKHENIRVMHTFLDNVFIRVMVELVLL